MVSVLASCAVDRGFKPQSGICCFYSQHSGVRAKTGGLGIRIMCPSGATCLPVDCWFSDLALLKFNSACWSRTKRTSSSSHCKLKCSRHDIGEKLLNWR
jgi:hypothetical protein